MKVLTVLERRDERSGAAHSYPVLAYGLGYRETVDLIPGQILGNAETRLLGRSQDFPSERGLVRESVEIFIIFQKFVRRLVRSQNFLEPFHVHHSSVPMVLRADSVQFGVVLGFQVIRHDLETGGE